jgi:biopolymer transport protein TolR
MAGASLPAGGSGGRRKSLDAEVNLVPFIDLLSMCICFLLMTAVWLQIGSVQVKQSHGTDGPASEKNQFEMDIKFVSATQADLQVKQGSKIVHKEILKTAAGESLAQKLESSLKLMEPKFGVPSKDRFASAMLTPVQAVQYGDMVSVMDVLRKNQIVNLGVVPTRVR